MMYLIPWTITIGAIIANVVITSGVLIRLDVTHDEKVIELFQLSELIFKLVSIVFIPWLVAHIIGENIKRRKDNNADHNETTHSN